MNYYFKMYNKETQDLKAELARSDFIAQVTHLLFVLLSLHICF